MKNQKEIVYGVASFVSFVLGFSLVRVLSLSSKKALLLSIGFADIFIDLAARMNFQQSVATVITDLLIFALPFVPMAVGFGVLLSYGMKHGEDKKLALAVLSLSSIAGLLITGATFTGLFFCVGVVSCGIFVTGLGEAYPNELKRWRNFRTGTKAAGKIFMLLSIALTIGLLVHTSQHIDFYRGEYKNTTREVITGAVTERAVNISALTDEQVIQQLPEDTKKKIHDLPEGEKEKIIDDFKKRLEQKRKKISTGIDSLLMERIFESQRFKATIEFALFSAVLAIGAIFFFLEKVLYGPVIGLVTYLGRIT